MPRHSTYTLYAKTDGTAQALVDDLRRPLQLDEDETGDAGMGRSFCPAHADKLPGWGPSPNPNAPATHRTIAVSVHPDREERFLSILDDHGVEYGTWHPRQDVDSDHGRPQKLPEAAGLQRVPDQAEV